jgi:hypothetical protein
MEEAPPNAIQIETTSTTTTEAPQTSYYGVPSTGLCVVVDDKIPSWIGEDDIFTSYVECCKQSWNPDPCLLAAPPGLPTSQPSPSPSIAIIPQPTDAPDPTSNRTIHPTTERPISSEPTTSPVEIAEYESSCQEAGPWHPTDDFSMCTNTFDYDTSWDNPMLSSTYLHQKLSGCCEKFFYDWDKECVYRDICTSSPTKNPVTDAVSWMNAR